jgi:hypothetical protein
LQLLVGRTRETQSRERGGGDTDGSDVVRRGRGLAAGSSRSILS